MCSTSVVSFARRCPVLGSSPIVCIALVSVDTQPLVNPDGRPCCGNVGALGVVDAVCDFSVGVGDFLGRPLPRFGGTLGAIGIIRGPGDGCLGPMLAFAFNCGVLPGLPPSLALGALAGLPRGLPLGLTLRFLAGLPRGLPLGLTFRFLAGLPRGLPLGLTFGFLAGLPRGLPLGATGTSGTPVNSGNTGKLSCMNRRRCSSCVVLLSL